MRNRPPRTITPQEFFDRWLPAEFAAQVGKLPAAGGDLVVIRSTLEGEGGGAWDMRVQGTRLETGPAGADQADVHVQQTVRDWRAFIAGEDGAMDLVPAEAGSLDGLFVDAQSQQMLKLVGGTLRFEVEQYNGRTWALVVTLGKRPPSAPPDATIAVAADVYAQILNRTLPAPQAFFQGQLRLTGDVNLAMQLGMALMPKFG